MWLIKLSVKNVKTFKKGTKMIDMYYSFLWLIHDNKNHTWVAYRRFQEWRTNNRLLQIIQLLNSLSCQRLMIAQFHSSTKKYHAFKPKLWICSSQATQWQKWSSTKPKLLSNTLNQSITIIPEPLLYCKRKDHIDNYTKRFMTSVGKHFIHAIGEHSLKDER